MKKIYIRKEIDPTKSLLVTFPEVAAQWHSELNGVLTPDLVTAGSGKKVWWKCSNQHEFNRSIYTQVRFQNCPYCSGKRASQENNLRLLFPEIAKEWHPTLNGKLRPEDVTYASNKKIWWLCKKKHEYDAAINNRTASNHNCPFCSGQRTSKEKSLKINFPEIAKEWHPSLNGKLKPEDVTVRSGRKVWWICKKNHTYDARIVNRTKLGTGCRYCSNQSSKPEMRILSELKFIFPDIFSRHKIQGMELDIFIPKYSIGIEYDGHFFHKSKESTDQKKFVNLINQGIKVYRIREAPLALENKNDILVSHKELTKQDINNLVIKILCELDAEDVKNASSYIRKKHFLNPDLYNLYINNFPSPLPEKSLKATHPNLAAEWDSKKNHPLMPENFTYGSEEAVWWICKANHIWKARIANRAVSNTNCPYCSGNLVTTEKNLMSVFPDIAKEWHPTLNGKLKPEDITPVSGKKYWWLCKKNHDYSSSVANRTKLNRGCPFCTNQKVNSENSLKSKFPQLAAQWHPELNGDLTPNLVTAHSGKKVWWVSTKDGEAYQAVIANKVRKYLAKS